jgi:hypothetical protein
VLESIVQGSKIMGITVEEYLADRKPCSTCMTEGNVEYCVTHMLSRADNCMIYNSINFNKNPKDDADVALLQNLRATPGAEQVVLDYYLRSEPIVKRIKAEHGEDVEVWDQYYQQYVKSIIDSLKAGDNDSAISKIFLMISALETA